MGYNTMNELFILASTDPVTVPTKVGRALTSCIYYRLGLLQYNNYVSFSCSQTTHSLWRSRQAQSYQPSIPPLWLVSGLSADSLSDSFVVAG